MTASSRVSGALSRNPCGPHSSVKPESSSERIFAAGRCGGFDDQAVGDSVVVRKPGGGGEAGYAAADNRYAGLQSVVSSGLSAVKSASREAAAVTPATIAASSGRNVGVWT